MRYRKLLLIIFFILFGFGSQIFSQTTNSPSITQFEGLEFDKQQAFMICPLVPLNFNIEEPIIEVMTKILEQSQNLKYQYSVSGGQVVGTGADVTWDLNKMPPGLYKIRVDIRGKNLRKRFVKEIRLNQPPACDPPCLCPTISIETPSQKIKEGKNAIFIAQVRGGSQSLITYKWTVTEGEIFKGQGTPKIQIKTNGLKGMQQ